MDLVDILTVGMLDILAGDGGVLGHARFLGEVLG